MSDTYLKHHGVKGQKWGVRRYQYADGTYTPAGKKRYSRNKESNRYKKAYSTLEASLSEIENNVKTQVTGRQYADTFIKKGTTLSRIQSHDTFEKYAFYATYDKSDTNKYMGLFGKNLKGRANYEARKAERLAKETGDENIIANARELRKKADEMKVYQLKIKATNKLRVPSDTNAGHIIANLLKDDAFRDNLEYSISNASSKMRRPAQQLLFKQAQVALDNDVSKMSKADKIAIYKAFNVSLVNHDPKEVAAQDRFYTELKKKGYNALLDYNDKDYSSYHAKRPMIVFDLDSVQLDSVCETNPKVIEVLNKKYNRERLIKETSANTVGLISKWSSTTMTECNNYIRRKVEKRLM